MLVNYLSSFDGVVGQQAGMPERIVSILFHYSELALTNEVLLWLDSDGQAAVSAGAIKFFQHPS